MKIFISYRRADSTYVVGRIKDRLVAAFGEQSVFRDLDDIPAGANFTSVLERETNECKVMLVVIGPQWAGITDAQGGRRLFDPNDYTRIEVETGLRRLGQNKITVIPVLVMGARMPHSKELPESLGEFTKQNAIEIRNDPDFNGDINKLVQAIKLSQVLEEGDNPSESYIPKTIYIAAGSFLMGSLGGKDIPVHEMPQHEVNLPPYRIGKYPVTNAEYEVFIHETGRLVVPSMGWNGQRVPAGGEQYPASGVTWYEALAYVQWLSKKTGRSYSLPNEAQWEKACRGGKNYIYPWGNEFNSERSNHGHSSLAPVDAYPAQNDFDCFDLVGNIRQWTSTLWGEKLVVTDIKYGYPWADDQRNNINAGRHIRRVVRGSSFAEDVKQLRCGVRSGQFPEDASSYGAGIGFRVVINL